MTPDHLTPAETAKHLGLKSAGTLANWRVQGRGPRYVKHGRRVLYAVADVAAYKAAAFRPSELERNAEGQPVHLVPVPLK